MSTTDDVHVLSDAMRAMRDRCNTADRRVADLFVDTLTRWIEATRTLEKRQMGPGSVSYLQDEAAWNAAYIIADHARSLGDTDSAAYQAAQAMMLGIAPRIRPTPPKEDNA